MIREKSLAVYKNRPALVIGIGEKITITLPDGEELRVREKDIEAIHAGPCSLSDLKDPPDGDSHSAWELLQSNPDDVTLKELAELVYGEYTVSTAWASYQLLKDGLYFSGDIKAIKAKTPEEVLSEEQKRTGKRQDKEEREEFLQRFKNKDLKLPDDARFLQDVEALAYGKSEKSRTVKDLGKTETPEEAHKLLLDAGLWTPFVNPYPARFGVSTLSPKLPLNPPPKDEERVDLTHLKSFAIDNAWSKDPDDAVSVENSCVWVHIADPASVVTPESPADIEARGRGATLYLPEGAVLMLPEESLPFFALGLEKVSPAISFKIPLNGDFSIDKDKVEILRSIVSVTRLTYEGATSLTEDESNPIPELKRLYEIAMGIMKRRMNAGAVSIEMPETHITVSDNHVSVEQIKSYSSSDMVREFMLLAGSAAAHWALKNRIPFPYISQEVAELPSEILSGMAGYYQIRRCMRARTLSVKPGVHWGLGLDIYSQVTSPLRRYTDLLAHQQIRAFLKNEAPLTEEELLLRLGAGEASALTVTQAERASKAHWTAVYLSDKKGETWDAVYLEKKGARSLVIIPDLALETQVALKKDAEPNETVKLTLSSVKIPSAESVFIASQ